MSAGHFMRGGTGRKQIFLADWTVGHVFPGLAVVIIKKERVDAHPAIMTVPEILSSTDPAKSTIETVVWIFII
jgi:hypothetical protein